MIPVVDLFAGPGGLAEGFSQTLGLKKGFSVKLSIEKDPHAHATLLLRAFTRQFRERRLPGSYYSYLRGERPALASLDHLLALYPKEAGNARREARHLTLGPATHERVDELVGNVTRVERKKDLPWVLIGGPPCQAYSLVGRSRMRGVRGDAFYDDERHTLYEEYLRIIRKHRPAAFVMENVKGLLSSTIRSERVLSRILEDLQDPGRGLHYRLYSLTPAVGKRPSIRDFVVRAECHGIPQARHRVIIVGVLEGASGSSAFRGLDQSADRLTVADAIQGLPQLRSGLSKEADSDEAWLAVVHDAARIAGRSAPRVSSLGDAIAHASRRLKVPMSGRGAKFLECETKAHPNVAKWLLDSRLGGVCNHETRAHIRADLHRYFFAACYAQAEKRSPRLEDFPASLRPLHRNVQRAIDNGLFNDRFRVQASGKPASTVTSHIAKDGHYFIHPSPEQCRSLTVREAARLQTFPDNYYFEGPRTEQYRQVGNAVPPYLAFQIAKAVSHCID